MLVNDLHVQIATAFPPLHEVRTRKGTTFRALIQTDEGRKPAYLKLLSVEDVTREVLCATLARKVHLPIMPCYYVQVDTALINDDTYINPYQVAFGIEEDRYPAFRGNSRQLDPEIIKWEDALKCAAFDEWIYNNDRNPGNLVRVSSGVFWLIDHDEALPNYATPESPCGSTLLVKLAEDLSEFERHKLKQQAVQIVEQYEAIDWNEILDLVRPGVLPTSEKFYRKHIKFLQQRIAHLPDIISESLGIKQGELELEDTNKLAAKKKNKEDTREK